MTVLILLIAVTIAYIFINAYISNMDYINPFVMCGLGFLFAEVMCLFGIETYDIHLHFYTLAVFIIGFGGLTFGNLIGSTNKFRGEPNYGKGIQLIEISNSSCNILIILQIVVIYSFIRYLRALSVAHQGYVASLPEMIRLYNNLSNFWISRYNSLNVPIPMVFRIGGPIANAAAYIVTYVLINNAIIQKRVNYRHIIIVLLLAFNTILTSSRTPLFNLILMIISAYCALSYRNGTLVLGNIRGLIKLVVALVGAIALAVGTLYLIGRGLETNLFEYVFTYTGAPLLNLDTFLTSNYKLSEVWGLNTFGTLYRYVFKLLGLDDTPIRAESKVAAFTIHNGINTGNVYTVFYPLIRDFDILGVFILQFITGLYYSISYSKIYYGEYHTRGVDFNLFIFSYLYIGMAMQFFASEFFGTICGAPFLKHLIISYILIKITGLSDSRLKIVLGRKQYYWNQQ